jgi:tight adherence protein B
VVIRRTCAVGGAALAVVLAVAAPARATDPLTVTVAAAAPGQVQLSAFVHGGSAGQPPAVTVAHNGTVLPSRPEVVRAAASPSESRAVVVVLDAGGSMAGPALQAAEGAVLDFARAVPADVEVGLVTVANAPSVLVRPTGDREAIGTALGSVPAATGSTDLYSGVSMAADLVAGSADKAVLIISDGQGTGSGGGGTVVQKVGAAGVRVDVVAFRAKPDQLNSLRQLATATGGTAYPAASPDALSGAVRSAAATVPVWLSITVTVPATLAGSAGSLTVAVTVGATTLTATVPVRFAASTSRTAVASRTTQSIPGLRPPLLAVLVFLAIMAAGLLATAPLRRTVRPRRLSQLDRFRLTGQEARRTGPTTAVGTQGTLAHAVHDLSHRAADFHGMNASVAVKLERAGMTVRPGEWVLLRTAAAVVGSVLLALLAGLPGLLPGAALGWLAAGAYRRSRESRRRRAFAEQLPDALQLIVGSLKSGFSLAQAIDAVSRDLPAGPLTAVFGRAIAETRIGADLSDALERAAERVDNEDMAWVVMAVRIQRDTGGNLAEVLQTTVDTLRERERLRRHVWALSAEGRLSAYILIALPILMGGFMFVARRAYLSALWTTRTGLVMLFGSIALMVIGSIWMWRWVKVEV